MLKSGFLLQQMIINSPAEVIEEAVERDIPAIKHLFCNQITPLVTIDNHLNSLENEKLSLSFPFEEGANV